MTTQPPPAPDSPIQRALAFWAQSPTRHSFCDERVFEASVGQHGALPDWVVPALRQALADGGIASLYAHQLRAAESIWRGADVVIATPTASGKSLCYNLPVLSRLAQDPNARALYLFPTKALARDQVEGLRALIAAAELRLGVAVYDGDTPPGERRAARRARIIATNPDMLHTGILPHHPSWAEWLAGLTHVVLDELHVYRGVFGAHVANVLRRLRRIAQFHGAVHAAAPRFVGTSATIANPDELAAQMFGRPAELIQHSSAPSGQRHFRVYNPPPIDPALGVRESYLKSTCRIVCDLTRQGVNTIVFCRSRQAVEVLVRYVRETLTRELTREGDGPSPAEMQVRVRGYRGGYLPDRRRGVEASMRAGTTEVVIATSALELGIDIGGLDAVVLAGWPGSRAAAWQRAGRAGRRQTPSLTVLVSSSDPLDQFVATDPEFFFGQAPEHARTDPENPAILVPHIKCGAFELPFAPGEAFGALSASETEQALDVLAESSLLHKSGGRFHYVGSQFPANDVTLRGPLDENFLVVDEPHGEVLAEVDYRDVPQTLHDHAIYQLEGQQYLVRRLDHDQHKAYVSRVEVNYYTDAITHLRLRVLESHEQATAFEHGEIHVSERVAGFKKIKLFTHENIGYGEVTQPDRQMHTTAMWLTLPETLVRALDRPPAELASAALGLSRLLHTAAALILMGDGRDLGRAVGDARSGWFSAIEPGRRGPFSLPEAPQVDVLCAPTLFFYDRYPGGTGLSDRLFDERRELVARATALLARCACDAGCPACLGPASGAAAKALSQRIVHDLATNLEQDLHPGLPRLEHSMPALQTRP